jgi:hypothetical protein
MKTREARAATSSAVRGALEIIGRVHIEKFGSGRLNQHSLAQQGPRARVTRHVSQIIDQTDRKQGGRQAGALQIGRNDAMFIVRVKLPKQAMDMVARHLRHIAKREEDARQRRSTERANARAQRIRLQAFGAVDINPVEAKAGNVQGCRLADNNFLRETERIERFKDMVQQRPATEFGGELIRRSKTFRPTSRQNDAPNLVRGYTHSHVPELDDAERQRDRTSYPDFYARASQP